MGHRDHDTTTTAAAAATSSTLASTSSSTATICPALPNPINDADPIAGSLSFHTLSEYLCIAFAGVAVIVAVLLILRHAMHLSRPREQIKIMRLTALIPVFALISVGNNYLGTAGVYLLPWMDVCDSISLVNFFFLIRAYLAEADHDTNQASLKAVGVDDGYQIMGQSNGIAKPAPKKPPPVGQVRLMTIQYIVVAVFVAALTDITQVVGRYCLNSNNYHFAHIWLELIRTLSVMLAVIAVLRFTSLNKDHIAQHKPMVKLIAFKLVVFLQVVQGAIFSYAGNHITPTTKVSYVDLTVGIPALILCAEMSIFAVVFHFVYRVSPYETGRYQGGPLGIVAVCTAFNPFSAVMDIVRGY